RLATGLTLTPPPTERQAADGRMPPRLGAAQRAPRLKGYATMRRDGALVHIPGSWRSFFQAGSGRARGILIAVSYSGPNGRSVCQLREWPFAAASAKRR